MLALFPALSSVVQVTGDRSFYAFDGNTMPFAVTPGATNIWNVVVDHPLGLFGQHSGCEATYETQDYTSFMVQIQGVSFVRGLWAVDFPTDPSCYPLSLVCWYHTAMTTNGIDHISAATPPSPPPPLDVPHTAFLVDTDGTFVHENATIDGLYTPSGTLDGKALWQHVNGTNVLRWSATYFVWLIDDDLDDTEIICFIILFEGSIEPLPMVYVGDWQYGHPVHGQQQVASYIPYLSLTKAPIPVVPTPTDTSADILFSPSLPPAPPPAAPPAPLSGGVLVAIIVASSVAVASTVGTVVVLLRGQGGPVAARQRVADAPLLTL